jgi:thiamine-phosphate pyrophosphorylase
MKPLAECRLYAFVDTAYLNGRAPEFIAQQLCDGGADLIQLRAKNSSLEEIRSMAEAILPVTLRAGVGLVINDHLSIARELGAPLCHLGQEDFFAHGHTHITSLNEQSSLFSPASPKLRSEGGSSSSSLISCGGSIPPPDRGGAVPHSLQIGLSTHSPDQACQAIAAGADYIAIGPVYATGTKPSAKPVTLDYVRWASANVTIPWFAIGGINLSNIDDVLGAGAQRICVVSAILNCDDIAATTREYKKRLQRTGVAT